MCIKYRQNGKRNIAIKYKYFIIIIMIISTSIAIIDRFTLNLWPLFLKYPESPIMEDWSATTFIVVCWICGRELIVSSAFIYLLQCKCLMNYIFENKPSWLIIDDIHIENNHLHYHIGWLCIALPVLIHAWLVFLPLFNHENHLKIYQTWMRPIDPQTGFYVENCHHHNINVSLNDIYALLAVTVCFILLFPLSMSHWVRNKKYTLATYLHLIAAAIYGIELIRTPFTVHCWFFCGPIMMLYVGDRLYGIFFYRTTKESKLICKYNIDNDYVILFLHIPTTKQLSDNDRNKNGAKKYLGDVYWINTKKFVKNRQFAHPFTTFYNHSDKLYGNIEQSLLFSSAMRHTLSHRGHRFPIRTHQDHHHVLSQELQHNKQNRFDLMRTDTAMTGISLSGLKVPDTNHNLRQDSASESVQLHRLHLENVNQCKLHKLSENNIKNFDPSHQRTVALSELKCFNNRFTFIPNKLQTPCSKSERHWDYIVGSPSDGHIDENKQEKLHNSNIKHVKPSLCNSPSMSIPTKASSHSESEEEDDIDYISQSKPSKSIASNKQGLIPEFDPLQHSTNSDARSIRVEGADLAPVSTLDPCVIYTNANKSDNHKQVTALNAVNPSKRTIRNTSDGFVIKENDEMSFYGASNMKKNTQSKSTQKKVRFGSADNKNRKRWIEDNLWLDENAMEQYKWNVGIIMKVHRDGRENNFTQYVKNELGFSYDDTRESTSATQNDEFDNGRVKPPIGWVEDDHNEYKYHKKNSNEGKNNNQSKSNQSGTNTFTDRNGHRATHIYTYGPYRSGFGHVIDECLINKNPVVLIGTGAGVSYILDFLMYTRANEINEFESRVDIHFSCRSIKLFQWITDLICGPTIKKQNNLYINAHLTSHKNINGYNEENDNKARHGKIGRASFESVLRNSIVNTKVFFCGAPIIQKKLEKICQELHFKLYKSHSFQ